MADEYIEYAVHTVKDNPREDGSFRVDLIPERIDPDRLLGAQLLMDTFTPDPDCLEGTSNSHYGTVYEGVIGDPNDGEPATLTVYELAQRQNRRAKAKAGLGRAFRHTPEGTLWVIPRTADH